MSHNYELARTDPDSLSIELLTDTPAVAIKRKAPVAKPAEPATPEGGADV
jgi:hypothetical protein